MSGTAPPTSAYEDKPAFKNACLVGLQAGGVGAFISAIQTALGTHSRGASAFLTRTGSTIGLFAAMGVSFAFTEAAVANHRRKDDAVNGIAGGCAAGFLAGVRARSLPLAVSSCVLVGAAVGTFDYAGKLSGDPSESRDERRKRFFKQPKALVETD